MTKTVLILGASGKIGVHAARAFAIAGWTVRKYNRHTDDMCQSAMGCDVIVNGLNPPNYHDWATNIPAITTQVIAAARQSGATVIVPGNVYVYGDMPGEWSETTPHRPCSRKGHIRAEMERTYRQSGVQTIVLRAGNFIDPNQSGDVMNTMVLNGLTKRRMTFPGGGDVVQPWCYLPDWARAAQMLADKRTSLTQFEDIPFAGHAFTLNELRTELETALGHTLKPTSFVWWVMRLSAPVWELARELLEMRYLWNTAHTLAPQRLAEALPAFKLTSRTEVIQGLIDGGVVSTQTLAPKAA